MRKAGHVFLCGGAEAACAAVIESKVYDWLAATLIETRLRIGQLLTGDNDALFNQIGLLILCFRAVEYFQSCGGRVSMPVQPASFDLRVESELRCLADNIDELSRVTKPRTCNNTIDTLLLDGGLDEAHCIDTTLDDLSGLFDGLTDSLNDGGFGNCEPDKAAAGIDDVDISLASGAEDATQGL